MERIVPGGAGQPIGEPDLTCQPDDDFQFPALNGVDVTKGLETWQSAEAYTKALLSFSNTYGTTASDLFHLIDGRDVEAAYCLAHKLKGVAGNLSIGGVFKIASKISDALKEEKIETAREVLGSLEKEIETAVESIRQLEKIEEAAERPKKKPDSARVSKLFRKMLAAFEQFNPDTVEPYLKELRSYISEQQIAPIARQIDEFHFIGAKEKALKLAEELGIDVGG